MDATDLARWQFAITTVYHFLFVPITIGTSAVVAWYHTQWVRTHKQEYLRLAKFFGKLFVINFALGLVTGIVQEFQFGMNWASYSRFVGDIFGAPLAFEALLAFFLESTFLGLWIFGWGKIPEKLHASCMWIVHIGTVLSAFFILAANSFMQNPVGFRFNPTTGRAEMTDFWAVLNNPVQYVTFPHVIAAAYMVGGGTVMGVGLWLMRREAIAKGDDVPLYRRAVRGGAILTLVAGVAVAITGDVQGKIMTEVQPMKMAAAEALYATSQPAPFSVLSIGSMDGEEATRIISVPGLLSFLATGSFDGKVDGINNLKETLPAQIKAKAAEVGMTDPTAKDPRTGRTYLPQTADELVPNIPLAYWTFRLMIGVGLASAGISALVLWLTRKGKETPTQKWLVYAAIAAPLLPVFGNSFGWIFTETGRQPWLVYGLMTTSSGISPSVSAGEVLFSMIVYTLLYAALAVVEIKLFLTYVRRGAEPFHEPVKPSDVDDDAPLQFAY